MFFPTFNPDQVWTRILFEAPFLGWLSRSGSGRLRTIKPLHLQGFAHRSNAWSDGGGSAWKKVDGGTAGTKAIEKYGKLQALSRTDTSDTPAGTPA